MAPSKSTHPKKAYIAPKSVQDWALEDIFQTKPVPEEQQKRLLGTSQLLRCAGDVLLLTRKSVAVVGTRQVSPEGIRRTQRLARELAEAGVVVVSGLAFGVDEEAHKETMRCGGQTVGVIGTGLSRAYPIEHADLQREIYERHLLVSPFVDGAPVHASNWPSRNKVMAAISDATIIVEASETSGTIHQASECVRLKRPLFFLKSMVDNPSITWPKKFLNPKESTNNNVFVLTSTSQIFEQIRVSKQVEERVI